MKGCVESPEGLEKAESLSTESASVFGSNRPPIFQNHCKNLQFSI
jgi:hypothetical protein